MNATLENTTIPTFSSVEVKPEEIQSEAIKQILAEVLDGRDASTVNIHGFDRTHNRHNR